MADIEISIYPDPMLIAAELDLAAKEIEIDPGPIIDSLGVLMASIEQTFMEQGPGWDAWSESYAASMGRRPHGPLLGQEMILIREADLLASTQDPANYVLSEDGIEWDGGASPEYWEYHQEGTSKMPARPFLRWTPNAVREIRALWTGWLGRKISVVRG